ncbi:hypothetical protein BGX20_006913 [Mortierella sp. AD010]|nr:hypothetical protein BGX20_006913 [Mortierella sp. AD010]
MNAMVVEMKTMFTMVCQKEMFKSATGSQASQESVSSLSSYRSETPLADNRPSKKAQIEDPRRTAPNPRIPSTNVSRAGIDASIVAHQTRSKVGTAAAAASTEVRAGASSSNSKDKSVSRQ